MNRSHRHHYLPEFFLKEFANEEGKLFVYNKEKDVIEPDPKNPKSIFFEWDRNTSKLDGQEFTWIENLYSHLDNSFSKGYKSIISGQSRITEERDMIGVGFELIMFINFIRWRVPARDSIINTLFEKHSFHDFSFHLVDQIGNKVENPAIEKFLSSFEPFIKAQSASMIFEPFNNYDHIKFVTEKLVMVSGTNNATLICDNPFIERDFSENVKEISEFFFPLSKNRLVFYIKNYNDVELNGSFSLLYELAKFESATKYVASANLEVLQVYTNHYQTLRSGKVSFIQELFSYTQK